MNGRGRGSGEGDWYQSDGFWEAAAGHMFGDEAWRKASADAERLFEWIGLERGSSLLDLGCGPGRYALPLARLGCEVTGVDRTEAFLAEARRRADADGLDVELVRADMREFVRAEAYDVVISMLTSFGYFEDPDDDLKVLENVLESLRPGGILLIDTIGKEVLGRIFQARDWKRVDDEVWLFERRPVRAWSWMENTWIRIHGNTREEFEIGHRLYSAFELGTLARAAGFTETAAYGDLEGGPYDQNASRLVVLARKAE